MFFILGEKLQLFYDDKDSNTRDLFEQVGVIVEGINDEMNGYYVLQDTIVDKSERYGFRKLGEFEKQETERKQLLESYVKTTIPQNTYIYLIDDVTKEKIVHDIVKKRTDSSSTSTGKL